jgi:hypothetical protein
METTIVIFGPCTFLQIDLSHMSDLTLKLYVPMNVLCNLLSLSFKSH